jgi:threonine/homoserine/homoserine lactone efflux protein
MEAARAFLNAFGVGVAIAAPVGPLALYCMRETLARGARSGLAVGVGVAAGDTIYAAVAAFGLAGAARALQAHHGWLDAAGGLLLIALGVNIERAAPDTAEAVVSRGAGLARTAAATVTLVLANPLTIASFAAFFATLSPPEGLSSAAAAATAGGVGAGSFAWWCTLVAVVGALRRRIGGRALLWINRLSAAVLLLFGAAALARAFV